jgi:hypothetical protein
MFYVQYKNDMLACRSTPYAIRAHSQRFHCERQRAAPGGASNSPHSGEFPQGEFISPEDVK